MVSATDIQGDSRHSWVGRMVALAPLLLFLIVLAACGGGGPRIPVMPSPTDAQPTVVPEPVPTDAPPTVVPEPAPTDAPPTVVPEPTPGKPEAVNNTAGTFTGRRMTVEEYAQTCAERDAPPDDFFLNLSYGELVDYSVEIIAWLKDMNPPEELAAYHDAQILVLESGLAEARSKPQDELFDPEDSLGTRESVERYATARSEVDDATSAVLIAAGCW